MTPPSLDLARRAVTCKGWRWMPRMAVRPVLSNGTVESAVGTVIRLIQVMPIVWWPDLAGTRLHHPKEHLLPDLSDPATLGCLLALVREAWGMPTGIIVRYNDNTQRWFVSWAGATHGGECGSGDTEAEALVTALENAP